jgi:putative membrane protein
VPGTRRRPYAGGVPKGWTAATFSGGRDPDPRFTLANERTFLAWVRTSLGLVAGGVAVEAFAADVLPSPMRRGLAAALLVLGAAVAVTSFRRWAATERALRDERPLPVPALAPVLAGGVALVALAVLGVVLLRG